MLSPISDLFITTASFQHQQKEQINQFKRQQSKTKSIIEPRKNQLFQTIDQLQVINKGIYKQAVLNLNLSEIFFSIQKIRQNLSNQTDDNRIKQFQYQLNCLKKQINSMNLLNKSKTKQSSKSNHNNKQKQLKESKKRGSKDPIITVLNSCSSSICQKPQKNKLSQSVCELKKILKNQINYRQKLNNFADISNKHLQNKNLFIKKKVQKAKQLNKQASQVYQKNIQKQKNAYQNFRIVPIFQPKVQNQKPFALQHNHSRNNRQNFMQDFSKNNHFIDFQKPETMKKILKSMKKLKSRVRFTASSIDQRKYQRKTVNRSNINSNSFEDKLQRIIKKKAQIDNQKQKYSIFNVIKKQLRINQAKQKSKLLKSKKNQKNSESQSEFHSKLNSPQKSTQKQKLNEQKQKDLQEKIKNRIKNKQFYLQQKTLIIQQKLLKKQQRRRQYYSRQENRFNKTCVSSPIQETFLQERSQKLLTVKQNLHQEHKIKKWHAKILKKQEKQKDYQKVQTLPLSILKSKLAEIQQKENQVPHFF